MCLANRAFPELRIRSGWPCPFCVCSSWPFWPWNTPRKFLGSIRGLYGNHLLELRRRWDVQGHRSNMASCSLGNVRLETREGIIDVRLLCEMRRFQSLPGEAESRGVAFYMFPLCEAVGCLWDGTEQMPKLFCQSASPGIEMRSWDLYRFDGKPGASTRGAVSFAVDEDDLRAELRMEPSAPGGTHPDVADGDEVILEDDATLWNETLSVKVGIHNFSCGLNASQSGEVNNIQQHVYTFLFAFWVENFQLCFLPRDTRFFHSAKHGLLTIYRLKRNYLKTKCLGVKTRQKLTDKNWQAPPKVCQWSLVSTFVYFFCRYFDHWLAIWQLSCFAFNDHLTSGGFWSWPKSIKSHPTTSNHWCSCGSDVISHQGVPQMDPTVVTTDPSWRALRRPFSASMPEKRWTFSSSSMDPGSWCCRPGTSTPKTLRRSRWPMMKRSVERWPWLGSCPNFEVPQNHHFPGPDIWIHIWIHSHVFCDFDVRWSTVYCEKFRCRSFTQQYPTHAVWRSPVSAWRRTSESATNTMMMSGKHRPIRVRTIFQDLPRSALEWRCCDAQLWWLSTAGGFQAQ